MVLPLDNPFVAHEELVDHEPLIRHPNPLELRANFEHDLLTPALTGGKGRELKDLLSVSVLHVCKSF